MKKNLLPLFLFLSLVITLAFVAQACSDDEIINPPLDPNVVYYNDLVLNERTIPFAEAFSAADLYNGRVVKDSDMVRDINLIDNLFNANLFSFRSGHLSTDYGRSEGYETQFKPSWEYDDLTQSQFDSVSVIFDTDSILTGDEFNVHQTEEFNVEDSRRPVIGFYLVGKYNAGITAGRKVFGLIYVDSAWTVTGTTQDTTKVRIDVKINTNGQNKFIK